MSYNSKYSGQQIENLLDQVANGGGSSSGSGAYVEVNHGTGDTTFTLTPNTFHIWEEVAALDLSLGDETSGIANEFLFQFTSGATPTTLTLPDSIKWANDAAPTIAENMIYQISILKGLASVLEFSNAVSTITFFVQLGGMGFHMFTCEKGMTWNDFVNSSYNTGEYKLSIKSDRVWWNYNCLNNETPSSIIVDGMQYNTTYAD